MNRLKVQPPPNRLIPIYGQKVADRSVIEVDDGVSICIKSNLLLTKDFYNLLTSLLIVDNDLKEKWRLMEDSENYDPSFDEIRDGLFAELQRKSYSYEDTPENDLLLIEVTKKVKADFKNLRREKLISEVITSSHKLEEIIDDFEKAKGLKKNTLDILTNNKFYSCGDCSRILASKYFKKTECVCGKSVENHASSREISFLKMSDSMVKFIVNNIWLEHGAEQFLNDYQTECGVYVTGSSGVMHEIDVIAQKGNHRLLIECKAKEIKTNDILIFYGKMMDLGISHGFIFTVDGQISEHVKKLSKSKNIVIISNILEIDKVDLRQKIDLLQRA